MPGIEPKTDAPQASGLDRSAMGDDTENERFHHFKGSVWLASKCGKTTFTHSRLGQVWHF